MRRGNPFYVGECAGNFSVSVFALMGFLGMLFSFLFICRFATVIYKETGCDLSDEESPAGEARKVNGANFPVDNTKSPVYCN